MDRYLIDDIPERLVYHSMITVSKSLIMYGGHVDSTRWFNDDLWKYDTILRVWKKYPKPPNLIKTTYMSSICAAGGLVYIFGYSSLHKPPSDINYLVSFDVGSEKWQELSSQTIIDDENNQSTFYGSSIVYFNESLYLFWGFDGSEYVNSIFKFCLHTLTWSRVQQNGQIPPHPGFRVFGTVFQDQYYCFGGTETLRTEKFKNVWVFDFSKNTWSIRKTSSKTQNFPCGRRNDEAFAFTGDCGYMSGGLDGTNFFDDIWKIDLKTLEWEELKYVFGFND
ncbi:Kelch domain-containing protein 10 [Thelohanellus kitauei]|uniref:Kelch domain-containing protein 10 n=1 Tax=Thelohanellus kitauei TaxID=669202 RepID=A0A0C2IVL9_THEKT|nr:Kelch domain-containing protein 10 [Thelohanellus kitauei]